MYEVRSVKDNIRKYSFMHSNVKGVSMSMALFYTYSMMHHRGLYVPDQYLQEFVMPWRLEMLMDLPPVSQAELEKNTWNPRDASEHIFVKQNDPLTFRRDIIINSTDCIRGFEYTAGLHAWEFVWPVYQRGSHAVLGVGTAEASLHDEGYRVMVGDTPNTWGLDLDRNLLYHNNVNVPYPHFVKPLEYMAPDKVVMVLDMDMGTLSYFMNGQYLGVAFDGLRGKKLHPMVSAVRDSCEVTMTYLGGLLPQPATLAELCRHNIRQTFRFPNLEDNVKLLYLPKTLKNFVLHRD